MHLVFCFNVAPYKNGPSTSSCCDSCSGWLRVRSSRLSPTAFLLNLLPPTRIMTFKAPYLFHACTYFKQSSCNYLLLFARSRYHSVNHRLFQERMPFAVSFGSRWLTRLSVLVPSQWFTALVFLRPSLWILWHGFPMQTFQGCLWSLIETQHSYSKGRLRVHIS